MPTGRLIISAFWLIIAGAIVWTYAWMASGGTWRYPSSSATYAEWLADAFLAGRLSLLIEPRPELLALSNPYDQVQSAPYRLPDASLFNGKYYLYFGPVPGLIHAAWRLITGGRIEESAMQLVAAVGSCFWFVLLARRLQALAFPRLSSIWANLAALCYTLGGVSLYLVARTIGHHEQILVGSFFVLGGYYFWLRGLEGGRRALFALFVGGLFLGLAFGSRHTLVGYPLACGLVMLGLWLRAPRDRLALSRLVAYGIGPGTCVVLHLIYNAARFGSPFDFGVNYVLTGTPVLNTQANFLGVLTLENVGRNLEAYLAYAPAFIALFPFQVPVQTLPFSIIRDHPTQGWFFEGPMLGMPIVAPLTLFIPFSLLVLSRRWRGPDMPALVPWFVLGATGGLIIPATVTMFQVATTARYLQDTLPVATILGAIGLWWLRAQTTSAIGRYAAGLLGAVVLILSVIMGGILGMSELSWDKIQAYARLTYFFDRASVEVLRITKPASWQQTYFTTARDRMIWTLNIGPFYVDGGTENRLITAPNEKVIRSMKVASLYDQPTMMIIELNGVTVAQERVFPGLQTMLLDEPLPVDPTKPVMMRLGFPDLPGGQLGSLRPVSIYAGTSRPDYVPAESQMEMIAELGRRVEEGNQHVAREYANFDALDHHWRALDIEIRAGRADPDAPRRFEEERLQVKILDLIYQQAVMKTAQDKERFEAETRYVEEKKARASAAPATP